MDQHPRLSVGRGGSGVGAVMDQHPRLSVGRGDSGVGATMDQHPRLSVGRGVGSGVGAARDQHPDCLGMFCKITFISRQSPHLSDVLGKKGGGQWRWRGGPN